MSTSRQAVLGTRRLRVVEDRPRRRHVTVTLGMPHPCGDDWECLVRVTGAELRAVQRVTGADALQAVQLAFEYAGATLDASGLRLGWGDPEPGARVPDGFTGFLRLVPPFFGPDGPAHTARVRDVIDREVARSTRALMRRAQASFRAAGQPWTAELGGGSRGSSASPPVTTPAPRRAGRRARGGQ